MNDVQAFSIALGASLSGLVVIAAWQFRNTSAPLAVKLLLPTLMLGCALFAGERFSALLGRPVSTTLAAMPEQVSLIAFRPVDAESRVDLWIGEGASTRAYEIPLDEQTKHALRQAQDELAQGRPVRLSQHKTRRSASVQGDPTSDDPVGFELDPIQPKLPPKD